MLFAVDNGGSGAQQEGACYIKMIPNKPEPVKPKPLTVAMAAILNSRMVRRFAPTAGGPFRSCQIICWCAGIAEMSTPNPTAIAPAAGSTPPDDPGDNSALQRARAVIRWHGQAHGQTPINRLMLAYWQAVGHAKELKLRGYSERAIAEIQGITKTPARHRLLKPFSLIRSEITRITAWLAEPEPIGITQCIGIDHHPPPATVIARYRSILTRYGWLCYLDRLNANGGDPPAELIKHTR